MALHVEPLAVSLRWYEGDDAGAFDRWEHFSVRATLVWCGPEEVFLAALHGRLRFSFRAELREYLLSHGVRRLSYLRRGRKVVREAA